MSEQPVRPVEDETPAQWRDRVLREHGPIPERVVTEVRRIFTAAAERRAS